jgi:hypothetical protein
LLINKNELVDLKRFADSYNISEPEAKKVFKFFAYSSSSISWILIRLARSTSTSSRLEQLFCANPHLKKQLNYSSPSTILMVLQLIEVIGDGFLGPSDVKVFTKSFMCGLNYFDEIPDPSDAEVDEKVKSLMIKWDH